MRKTDRSPPEVRLGSLMLCHSIDYMHILRDIICEWWTCWWKVMGRYLTSTDVRMATEHCLEATMVGSLWAGTTCWCRIKLAEQTNQAMLDTSNEWATVSQLLRFVLCPSLGKPHHCRKSPMPQITEWLCLEFTVIVLWCDWSIGGN